MKFERGKSLADPIYLKKDKGDYWMEGDVYEALCKCFDQIFGGRKKYFVRAMAPKRVDFFSGLEYYTCQVGDYDGDLHTFVARVVDELPSAGVQKKIETPKTEIAETKKTEISETEKNETDEGEKISEETGSDASEDLEESKEMVDDEIDLNDVSEIGKEIKMEIDRERLNEEFPEEEELTKPKKSDRVKRKSRKAKAEK